MAATGPIKLQSVWGPCDSVYQSDKVESLVLGCTDSSLPK